MEEAEFLNCTQAPNSSVSVHFENILLLAKCCRAMANRGSATPIDNIGECETSFLFLSTPIQIGLFVVYAVIFIGGVFGNSAVMVILGRYKNKVRLGPFKTIMSVKYSYFYISYHSIDRNFLR